jgi:hypothetical protein
VSKRVRSSKASVICSIRDRLTALFSVQNVRIHIISTGFINAVPLPRCHVHHVQHCVSRVVWERQGGIDDGAELGTSERADFRYGKEGGVDLAKAHFLARNK